MRILVTNDDGINAPGLKVLQDIARQLTSDVWTVAPETNQSGASHSLTLHEPLRCYEVAERQYAVRGTPTDCVIMGVRHVMLDEPPDLVLSGVNCGANLAEDVTYSGTIAGAMEGTLLGIRSIAMSLTYGFNPEGVINWETPRAHGPDIVRKLLASPWAPEHLMNVNFPDAPPDGVEGIMITRQGRRDQNTLNIDKRTDTWGMPYYWFGFERKKSNPPEGTDLWAIYKKRISITPLSINLTAGTAMERLADQFATPPQKQKKTKR